MRRIVAVLAGIVGVLGVVTTATAQVPAGPGTPVLVSGHEMLAIIDADGNGPDPKDCSLMAFLNGTALTIMAMQYNTPRLEACDYLDFMGTAMKAFDGSSNYGMVELFSSMPSGAGSLPVMAEWVDETPNPSATAPLRFDSPNDYIILSGGAAGSGALLCNAGGPAALVNIAGAPSMLWPLSRVEQGGTEYVCVPNLPLATNPASSSVFNTYIPLRPDGRLTMALSTSPQDLFADVNFNTLPGCAVAPTASAWGLCAVVLALLGIGTWTLARRPGFSQSLAAL